MKPALQCNLGPDSVPCCCCRSQVQDPKNPCLKMGVDTPKPGGVVGPEQQPMQRGKKRTTSQPKQASARKVARQGPRAVQVSTEHCS